MFNENTLTLSLGTVRNHFNELAHNVINLQGVVNGPNNIRDLGDITVYGNVLIQNSSPLALPAVFMRDKQFNFFDALSYNSRSYEKFRTRILDWPIRHDISGMTPGEILDAALRDLNINKDGNSPFYWSDMLPHGVDKTVTDYVINAASGTVFTTIKSYDFSKANSQALLVYRNGTLLLKDLDYTVASDGPRVEILTTLCGFGLS